MKGGKLLRHYGTKKGCHSELVSESHCEQMLKQCKTNSRAKARLVSLYALAVQHDKTFVKHAKGVLKKCAFTLSEVLIVLAVLGVVAAMTIPDLIQDYREKALITALKKNYSIFEQAFDMAQAENGPITSWDVGTGAPSASLKLYEILKPYLRIEKECGTGSGCFATHYGALFNEDYYFSPDTWGSYAKGVLASGTSFAIFANNGSWKSTYIRIDVNGKSGPNQMGVDTFDMWVTKNGLVPAGGYYVYRNTKCVYGDNSNNVGAGCTWWALKHENMDYLRKAGQYTKY